MNALSLSMQKNQYSVVSLFSGCGGLDLGFAGGFDFLGQHYPNHNFDILWANDIEKGACQSYQQYFNHPIVCGDIRSILDDKSLVDSPIPKQADIVLGGFPCQDFSHAGKRRGLESDRGTLYQAMMQVVKRTKPKLFLAENVKGLLTLNGGDALKTIIRDFESLGYYITYKLVMASDYGVPQKRERVIIVGTRKDCLPKFQFDDAPLNKNQWITLEQAIGDLAHTDEQKSTNHCWSKAKKNKGQGNSAVKQDEPGPTMRAEHHGNIEFHWLEHRRLSAREAARIQSFPDDFIFYPSTSSAYKQIGNAVPPVLAWHLAKNISKFLNTELKTPKSACKTSKIAITV